MTERQSEILAWIGRLAVSSRVPADRGTLCELLVEAGFPLEEVIEAIESADSEGSAAVVEHQAPTPAEVSQLSEDATRFLNALRDVGYLDDVLEDEVLDLVMQGPPGPVSLDDIRHQVAAVLFERHSEFDQETLQMLQQEWRLVFH